MTQDTEDVVARFAGHTPGPWSREAFNEIIAGEPCYDWMVLGADGESIVAQNIADRDIELAAAAPELLARVQSLSDRIDVLTQALERIEQNWGHCDKCGTPCEGFTDGCCDWASWAPDDPAEVARAALHQEGIAPK